MKIRIVVPMPCDVVMSKGTDASICALINDCKEHTFFVKPIYGSCIWKNRNAGIQDFDFDYCLQVDNRKIFKTEDFKQLLDMNVGVATGWYYLPPENFVSYSKYDQNKVSIYQNGIKEKVISDEYDFFSTGFHLVKCDVYKRIFNKTIEIYTPGHMLNGEHDAEDMGFCENLKLINEKIYVNKNVFVKREPLPFLKQRGVCIMGTTGLSKRTIQKIVAIANAAEHDAESKIDFSVSYALLRSAEKLKSAGRVISKERLKILGPEYDQKIKPIQDEVNKAAAGLDEKKDADKIAVINADANKKVQALDVEFKTQIEALNEYFDTVDEVEIYQCKIKSMEALNDVPNYIRPALVHLVTIEDSEGEKTDL